MGQVRKVKITQTATGAWAASTADIATDLDKTGLITRIYATAEITPNQAMTTAVGVDGLFRTVQNLKIEGGAHSYFSLPGGAGGAGGVLLHYLNRKDFRMVGHSDGIITAPSRTYVGATYVFHCGSRPQDQFGRDNPFDLTAFIPAHVESQLRALWTTGANTVMDDTTTVSSAVMRYTLCTVQGTEEEIRQEMARQGVSTPMVPAWIPSSFPHVATAPDYSEERDIPTGGFLKRIAIYEQNDTAEGSTPLRAEDQVTGIAIKLPLESNTPIKYFAGDIETAMTDYGSMLVDASASGFGNIHAPYGILIADLRPHYFPDYGMDMRQMTTGAVKLGLTITTYTSGDDSFILYERYQLYPGPLAGL